MRFEDTSGGYTVSAPYGICSTFPLNIHGYYTATLAFPMPAWVSIIDSIAMDSALSSNRTTRRSLAYGPAREMLGIASQHVFTRLYMSLYVRQCDKK